MLQIKSYQRTILYTILHFVVDGICACIIFSKLYNDDYSVCLSVFLIYNFLAFLSQPFVGLLIDRYFSPRIFLLISVVMISLGYLFSFQFIVSSIFLGIGNSFFHVCGGKDITVKSKNDILSLGVFVSTGAIGLTLGQRCYSETLVIIFFSILFLGAGILALSKEEYLSIENEAYPKLKFSKAVLFFSLILLVVLIRSFIGKIIPLEFEVSLGVFLGIAIATALGKALGGVAGKYLGPRKTILVSMSIAIVCLCLGNTNPYTLCLGVMMFNFSMPITLYYANLISKEKQGFAFGALAAALIPGYLLGMLEYGPLAIKLAIVIFSVMSALLVCYVCQGVKRYGAN
ncbi:MAG: hypothetical protein K2N42_04410 [Anaeroplasmataceae bacterium]|nr:hypothetical protein [Anaeroplasmataceae bacterium]